jgi:hypothetical protein
MAESRVASVCAAVVFVVTAAGCTMMDVVRTDAGAGGRAELGAIPLEDRLPVAPLPRFRAGDSFVYRFPNGSQQEETVTAARGERVDWRMASGARWTTVTGIMFNTSDWGATAGYGSGRQRFGSMSGSLFPMRVGNVLHYTAHGESTQSSDRWTQRWSCTVSAEERIRVIAGTFDTYRVICYRAGQLRTYYYAPELGIYVLRITSGRDAGRKELVSYRRAP